ncbi:MAG: Gfo/Idh/MocA family oxidoreductase [Tepidisphaeraceae bacterium]
MTTGVDQDDAAALRLRERMNEVRWGIIGCGDVTEVKSGPALQKVAGSRLVAVMRRDAAKAADYAKRHGVPAWYDDADRLINDPNVNAIYVATPPSSHADYACRAAAAGKAVYVEKPMATTADECRRMIAACNAAGVPLFVAYYRRRLPRFVKVKELIDSGAIGSPRTVSVHLWRPAGKSETAGNNWRVDPAIAGGGLFLDLASHTLDLLDELLGPLQSAGGTATNLGGHYDAEDVVAGHFCFQSGVIGSGSWCFVAGVSRDVVEIVGSRGVVRFPTFGEQPVTLENADGVQAFTIAHPPHVQQPLIETVVNNLLGRGVCPSTGETALRTTLALDAMIADWRSSQR